MTTWRELESIARACEDEDALRLVRGEPAHARAEGVDRARAASAGPSIPGMRSGRIEGTAGTQFATPRPASRRRSTFAASSSGSFISQIPIPSKPAAA